MSHANDSKKPSVSSNKEVVEFLGINFGISYSELKEVLKNSKNNMTFNEKKSNKINNERKSKGSTDYFYQGNHRLNGAQETLYAFWEDKLISIVVQFESMEAKDIYETLKYKIENKYGELEDKITSNGVESSLIANGLYLMLFYDEEPNEKGVVTFVGIHMGLHASKRKKKTEKKRDSLGEL
jgi:hypothetical protein